MSIESSTEQPDAEATESDDSYSFDCNWHISLDGYWEDVDPSYFGDDTPNEPPIMAVPEKLAADMEVIEDEELIQELVDWMYSDGQEKYSEVLKVTFNDFSTWHIPLRPWDKDYARIRMGAVERYVPEIIKWEAIVKGKNPKKALQEFDAPWEYTEPEWVSDFEHWEMKEDTRKWFNENADWLPYIDKTIKSDGDEVEVELAEDEDWTDDW